MRKLKTTTLVNTLITVREDTAVEKRERGRSENERGTSGTVNVITKSELRGRAGPDNPGAAPEGNKKAR